MKMVLIAWAVCFFAGNLYSQTPPSIQMEAPDKTRGSAFMKALSDRSSVREFNSKALSSQDLSDLLWAANGVNRPDGKRTAPSARNRQEIDVYAILPEGAYLYDASSHTLKLVAKGDHRALIGNGQDFVKVAPLSLLLVVNLEKLGDPTSEQTRMMGAVDAGIVSQNINVFCSSVGLRTVPRASMNHDELKKVLQLSSSQLPLINNPVGYPKSK